MTEKGACILQITGLVAAAVGKEVSVHKESTSLCCGLRQGQQEFLLLWLTTRSELCQSVSRGKTQEQSPRNLSWGKYTPTPHPSPGMPA